MKAILIYFSLFIFIVSNSSCKKDDDDLSPSGSNGSVNNISASFSGFVKDEQGDPLAGAVVSAGGSTAVTNASGGYKIQNASVNKKRAILEVTKAGFLKQQKAIIAESGATNYLDFALFSDNKSYSVNAVSGGAVTMSGGTRITFPANAFTTTSGAAYSGTVYITAHEILTSDNDFTAKIPGGDLMARDAGGNETLLLSYGMAGAELYDASGNKLQLASGVTASVRFPIAAAQSASAPATIPLWHYDESEKMWIEEGSASRNGNFYEGTVSHFSWWNCDQPCLNSTLTMNITDCQGNPLLNRYIRITWNGVTTSGITNSTGSCSGIVPANAVLSVTIQGFNSAIDTTLSIGPFANSSTNQITVQIFNNCNILQVNLTDCSGAPLSGSVSLSNGSVFLGSYAVTGGAVAINSLQSGTYTITGSSGVYLGTDTLTISTNFGTTNFTMALCDSISIAQNHIAFAFNDSSGGSVNVTAAITSAIVTPDTFGIGFRVILNYINPVTQAPAHLKLVVDNYQPAIYNWNLSDAYISGYIPNGNLNQQIYSSTSPINGYTNLISTPPVGGNLEGSFAGYVMYVPAPGNSFMLTGNFSAIRSQ